MGVSGQSWTQQGRDDEEGLQGVGNFRLGVRSAARKGKFFYGLQTFIALLSSEQKCYLCISKVLMNQGLHSSI